MLERVGDIPFVQLYPFLLNTPVRPIPVPASDECVASQTMRSSLKPGAQDCRVESEGLLSDIPKLPLPIRSQGRGSLSKV